MDKKFSTRAISEENRWPQAPAKPGGKTQRQTDQLIKWFAERAAEGNGLIKVFNHSDIAATLNFDEPRKAGRPAGNAQSRIDFACFELGLPPLGLTATVPYKNAWQSKGRAWMFPIAAMAKAARERMWAPGDFVSIAEIACTLPAKSTVAWATTAANAEQELKAWAERFGATELGADRAMPKEKSVPNDDWIRDELILALDLYLRHRSSPPAKTSPEIIRLSTLLVRLGEVLNAQRNGTYRNPNGVYMKIMNFRRVDPEYVASGKVGLGRGSKQEVVVWNEFAGNLERLREVAAAIRNSIESQKVHLGTWTEEEEEQTGTEGRILTRVHRSRERDPKLAKRKKAKVFRTTGKLACEACDADASETYGDIGAGLIDAHHTKPLHTLTEPTEISLDDLALLCATCHRVIHSAKPWLTVPKLREILEKRRRGVA